MIKPFHELTKEEFKTLLEERPDMTWEECAREYPQPEWCDYANAVQGMMGCWSLMGHRVTGPEYCSNCEFKHRRK